jgi:hypothetical protein
VLSQKLEEKVNMKNTIFTMLVLMSILNTGNCTPKKKGGILDKLIPLALLGGGAGNVTPTPSPAAGHYITPQIISFNTNANGGVVKCTTNNTDPTNATETWTPRHIWSVAGLTIKCGTFVNGSLVGTIQSYTYSYPPLRSGQTTVYAAGDDGTNQKKAAQLLTMPFFHRFLITAVM